MAPSSSQSIESFVSLAQSRRINVTGNAGAGKSTFTRALGTRLGMPTFGLDSVVWQSGWKKTPPSIRRSLEGRLIGQPCWIIDGVSKTVRDAADLVIFLDFPWQQCLKRVTLRTLRHLRHQRPGLPPGCPEWRIYPQLVRHIYRFPRGAGLYITREAGQDSRYMVVRDGHDLDMLLDALGA